jgi:dipeptidyl aminopeptidase/acylaminoacyl peptidase
MHGTAETTVPIAQSETMERELKRAGKSVEFVRLPDGDNEMSRADTRMKVLNELESFLAKYLGR